MRPPARPRAAGTARPRPADEGAARQERGAQEPDRRGRDLQEEARPRPAGRVPARPRQDPQDPPSRPSRPDRPARQDRPATGTTPSAGGRVGVVSDQLADRLAERTAMARYRVWRRIGWTALTVAVVAGVVWAAFFSPLFALDPDQVRVTGEGTTVDVGEVRDAATAEAGVPLPRLDTVGLREEILAMNAVKNVRITRSWPDGLAVALTSREPVAAVPQPGDVYALMDAEGVRVATVEKVPKGLPAIVTSLSDAGAGKRALDAALAVLGALPTELASDVKTVSAATQDDVRTTLSDGRVIRWGSGAEVPLKTKVAQTLLRAEPTATTIDVSSPGLPVTH